MQPKIEWFRVNNLSREINIEIITAVPVGGRLRRLGPPKRDLFSDLGGGYHCRDGLITSMRARLQSVRGKMDFSREDGRQAGVTRLIAWLEGGVPDPEAMVHTLDCLVALPALLVGPDRFTGDWWQTNPEELETSSTVGDDSEEQIAYNGVDNSIARHPAITSLIAGLFRQAICLERLEQTSQLHKLLPRERVTEVLNGANEKEALILVELARPWLEARCKNTEQRFPIGLGDWKDFLRLHRTIYEHGWEAVLGNVSKAWGLTEVYMPINGMQTFLTSAQAEAMRDMALDIAE